MEEARSKIVTHYQRLAPEITEVTAEGVKNAYLRISEKIATEKMTLCKLVDMHNDFMKSVLKRGTLKNYCRQGYTEKRGTKVTQYDAKGHPIAYYLSLQDAGRAINGHWTSISAVIRGKHKTAYGFRWKKGHHKRKLKPMR